MVFPVSVALAIFSPVFSFGLAVSRRWLRVFVAAALHFFIHSISAVFLVLTVFSFFSEPPVASVFGGFAASDGIAFFLAGS
jgi:hypothetical protein